MRILAISFFPNRQETAQDLCRWARRGPWEGNFLLESLYREEWRMGVGGMVRQAAIGVALALAVAAPAGARRPVEVELFWAENCPHCHEAQEFLAELKQRHPDLTVRQYEIWQSREDLERLVAIVAERKLETVATPTILVGEWSWIGFSPAIGEEIERVVDLCLAGTCPPVGSGIDEVVEVPLFGPVATRDLSLPVLTVVLGLLDSFNPCAFFVLLFLLSLMVNARSRTRMAAIGGTFILCSGAIYFLFMAAWLNLFRLVGEQAYITLAAGLVAVGVGMTNIKDYVRPKGLSLSIPQGAKPRLFDRMRRLVRAARWPAMLGGTLLLAVAANSYELLCTAGLPMVYTRVLTLHHLPALGYYGYLLLYNLVYVLPLLFIVILFTATLGRKKLTEEQGRALKLLSGLMMFLLGLTLAVAPAALSRFGPAVALPLAAVLLWGATLWFRRKRRNGRGLDGERKRG